MLAFALTIFTGAFLLFQVQPLIGKFILPWFGGSPAVWTTCMLFFQLVLLAGYAYAHVTGRYLKPRAQALLHIALLLAAALMLPIVPASSWKPVGPGDPTWRILTLLTVCLGLPYFVLSSTGPLMQEWFRRLNPGVAPYRLYALSNVGSLLALISFPFVIEPALSRRTQAEVWSWGLRLFVVLGAWCALRLWKLPAAEGPVETQEGSARVAAPTASVKALWFGLPAVASVLLLSTTNKMCQDVAVIPFLWVLPLSLYLLTFIICFDSPYWYFRKLFTIAVLPMIALLCYALVEKYLPLLVQILIYLGALFTCCMVCHGELYRLKPHPRQLTSFYLLIAAGGAFGGLFVALIAPLIFNSYRELHWGLLGLALLVVLCHAREKTVLKLEGRALPVWKCAAVAAIGLGLLLSMLARYEERLTVAISRNFYGVYRVVEANQDSAWFHSYALQSGGTLHGLQFVHPVKSAQPTSYYHEKSGVGLALRNFPRQQERRVGLVGLGIGTLAAYGQTNDLFRFYEINPTVQRFAQDPFTYLKHAKARVEIILGDARLSLENESPQQFDLLVLDAFSSDAIPVHLLTQQAFEIYRRHLKPEGVIAVNISNLHLDLRPVLQNVAAHFGWSGVMMQCFNVRLDEGAMPSQWVLLTTNQQFLDLPAIRDAATSLNADFKIQMWTDDYASLFKVLKSIASMGGTMPSR